MPDKTLMTAAEDLRRFQESLLPSFKEIAHTFLAAVPGDGSDLQKYLDGTVEVDGIRYRRRTVLLAIHDMNGEREAPLVLQNETLAYLTLLKVRPIPPLKLYRDVATAILRIEVVKRLGTAIGQVNTDSVSPIGLQAGWQGLDPDAAGPSPAA